MSKTPHLSDLIEEYLKKKYPNQEAKITRHTFAMLAIHKPTSSIIYWPIAYIEDDKIAPQKFATHGKLWRCFPDVKAADPKFFTKLNRIIRYWQKHEVIF
jgi:hypothetical protein